jgi:signal transduction histidine kinase
MKRDGLSFTARLNAWFAAVVIALSVLLFLAAYLLLYRAVVKQDRAILQAQWEVCRAWYEEGGIETLSSHLQESETGSGELFFVRVAGAGGTGLFVSIPKHAAGLDLTPLQEMTHEEAVAWLTLPSHNQGDDWLAVTERLPDGSWLQVGKTTEAQTALLAQFRRAFGWVVLIALVLGVAGGAWLTRRALAPIHQLIQAVQNLLATGRLSERMPLPEAHDEINRLARLFNTMLEKNDALIRGMCEALDNVAHELRTPLTRLRGGAELALEGEPDPQKSRDALLDSMEETDRVLTMLNTLMDISEAETGLMKLDRQHVVLADLAAEAVELFDFVAEEKRIPVTVTIPPELQCPADPRRLRQVLVNLLDNALKYTPAGGRVTLTGEARAGEIVLRVQDTGPGIPPEEQARIWERLYRGTRAAPSAVSASASASSVPSSPPTGGGSSWRVR